MNFAPTRVPMRVLKYVAFSFQIVSRSTSSFSFISVKKEKEKEKKNETSKITKSKLFLFGRRMTMIWDLRWPSKNCTSFITILTTDYHDLLRKSNARKCYETLLRLAVTRIILAIARILTACVFEKSGRILSKAFLNQKNKMLLNLQTVDTFVYPYDLTIMSIYNIIVRYSRFITRIFSDLSKSHYDKYIFSSGRTNADN